MFRKKEDRSSEFSADTSTVRRDGAYIYEKFIPTGGTDVRVSCQHFLILISLLRFIPPGHSMHTLRLARHHRWTAKFHATNTARLVL